MASKLLTYIQLDIVVVVVVPWQLPYL